ncbi:hypothetical protein F2Q70_00029985 [Brassica cretica]|uniref:Uncharacterized protein n=1 Tax=Brassica cretica TaxID=69181 RepID=A0A8S9FJ92_BRACR|nr:hypothetical protein F2Q70_00029985 [Brassica cretica]
MTPRKRSSKKKTSPQSSSGNPCTNEEIVPKEEFEVEEEVKEAYWDALCGLITPPPEVFYPTRPATQLDLTLPNRTSHAYLKTLREFYRVPIGVVFLVSVHGESAEDPPKGFFTCYESFLTRCHMWFPILEAIVRALDHFELSISQLNVAALENFLGVLILSYELGMYLSPDDFEGLWSTRKTSIDYSYRMAPKRHMSIIQGHTPHAKGWFERHFYVRNDGASVEGNCLPLFHGKWNFHRGTMVGNLVRIDTRRYLTHVFFVANSILPAISRDLFAKRDLLRNGPFFWDSFTLDRIRNAVALYQSRGISRPLRASDMDEPHPDPVPEQRERGDGSETSEAPLPDGFFANLPPGFTTPSSLDEASRREVVAVGSRLIKERGASFALQGRRDREEIHPFSERAESHSRALIRAERKGRRTIAAQLARRATLFDAEFRSFKDAQDHVGDFRECRGSVGTLWKSQIADFAFLFEVSEMSGLMDGCAQAKSMVPPIEGRIRELWEPIKVSEDTTEAGADAADEGGEVYHPADLLNSATGRRLI